MKVSVVWAYPLRKSEPKKRKELAKAQDLPCFTRPDVDNLQKGFFDQVTIARYWNDDSQIAEVNFKKVWSIEPRIELTIEQL